MMASAQYSSDFCVDRAYMHVVSCGIHGDVWPTACNGYGWDPERPMQRAERDHGPCTGAALLPGCGRRRGSPRGHGGPSGGQVVRAVRVRLVRVLKWMGGGWMCVVIPRKSGSPLTSFNLFLGVVSGGFHTGRKGL